MSHLTDITFNSPSATGDLELTVLSSCLQQRQNYFADNSNLSRSIYVSSTYYDSQTLEEAIADHTTTQGAREQQHQQVASQPSSNTLSSADQTECGGESESETPEYLKLRGDDDAWLEGDALSMVLTSGCCKLPSPEHLETDQVSLLASGLRVNEYYIIQYML